MLFRDRIDAGRQLAEIVAARGMTDVVVLGLPRGGVPVAAEVAVRLGAPLDIIVVRKVGVPSNPELAMGAIGEGGVRIIDHHIASLAGVDDAEFALVEAAEREELERRAARYRGDRPRLSLDGRTALIVDDGVATGSTARAASQVARLLGATRIVVAVPVAAHPAVEELRRDTDEVVSAHTPRWFRAVGEWYRDFSETTDADVVAALERGLRESTGGDEPWPLLRGASGPPTS